MSISPVRSAAIAALLLSAAAANLAAAGSDQQLFIYNWADFIGHDTVANFEKETGIKVTYDVYDAEETMDARLLAGSSGYDVVIASTESLERMRTFPRRPWFGSIWPNAR